MALERAAELTAEPAARAGRLAAAGQSAWQAGQLVRAAGLLEEARLLTADPIVSADVDQLRAWIELSIGSGMMARRLFGSAAMMTLPNIRATLRWSLAYRGGDTQHRGQAARLVGGSHQQQPSRVLVEAADPESMAPGAGDGTAGRVCGAAS